MSGLGDRVSLAAVSLASLVTGAILLAIGSVLGSRRPWPPASASIGHARERRWIPDDAERQAHAAIVARTAGYFGRCATGDARGRGRRAAASAPRRFAVACSAASWRASSATGA